MAKEPETKPEEPLLACKVLISGTTYEHVILGKGARVSLPKSKAEALASMNPPRVEITGV